MTIHYFTFSGPQGGSSRQRAFRIIDELKGRGFSIIVHTPSVLDISRTRWPDAACVRDAHIATGLLVPAGIPGEMDWRLTSVRLH